MRRTVSPSEWVFPAPAKSGHVEPSSLKKRHRKACSLDGLNMSRSTRSGTLCLIRWAVRMHPYTLAYYVGHSFVTARRYVHPNRETGRAAMKRSQEATGRHKNGHSGETADLKPKSESSARN